MSSTQFTQQAMKNMAPMLYEKNKIEIFATLVSGIWIFSGLFPDEVLYFFSMSITIVLTTIIGLLSFIPKSKYNYSASSLALRRSITGGIAHWAYFGGNWTGASTLQLEELTIPILTISQYTLLGLIVIWFSTKYYEQLSDPNIPSVIYPFIIVRGLLRAMILAALVFSIFSSQLIPDELSFPYLLIIYLVEPFIYGFSQFMNPTLSRYELTLGNARLPSVALRESFVSNFIILFFTLRFDGLAGTTWDLLQVYYLFGALFVVFYSMDAIKKFKQQPLGKNAIANFFNETPDILQKLDLQNSVGHVISEETMVDLSKKSGVNLDAGSIVVPLDEVKGKVNALVIGSGQSIVNVGDQKVGEALEGVSTMLIPKKEFSNITSKYMAKRMSEINLDELKLPSMEQLQQYIGILARNFEGFVGKIINQLNSIDLSNYEISESKGRTDIKLPGIEVHETPDLTSVNVLGLRVLDGKGATTVRFGNTFTVVDLPKASFVSLPFLTVIDLAGEGSAVDLFGFRISDGLPASKLQEIRTNILSQLDRWEMNIDAELGRYLADKSASGVLGVGWDGEFNLLLDSKRKTMGNHVAFELPAGKKNNMHYLPPNFDEMVKETTEEDKEFRSLTGLNPTPALKSSSKAGKSSIPLLSDDKNTSDQIPLTKKEQENLKSSEMDIDDYVIIHDVEIEEDDENSE